METYLGLLHTEIARFTQTVSDLHRHCCSNRQIALPGKLASVSSHAVRTFLRQNHCRLCSALLTAHILQQTNRIANEKMKICVFTVDLIFSILLRLLS